MEFQFKQTNCPCLRRVTGQAQTQEQVQEVKLSDAMPDIGRVLGCWGQPMVRSKEWRSDGMSVSGGVMAWVLYAPEDGSEPRCLDTWIPFQMKWNFPQTERDGAIRTSVSIKGMDCRSISARKLMVRCGISAFGEALEPTDVPVFVPESMPEDVELLQMSYPMEIPQEAGEKAFALDEEVPLTANFHKMIGCEIQPRITEQKVLADKLVFRGICKLHMLYMTGEGEIKQATPEIPFSQFADLDTSFGNNAVSSILLLPTGMELEQDQEGKLQLKCSMAAQYVIYDRINVNVVEDAYSVNRVVTPVMADLQLPVRLEHISQNISYGHMISADAQTVLDATAYWEQPTVRQTEDTASVVMPVQYQALFTDQEGSQQWGTGRSEETWELPSDQDNSIIAHISSSQPRASARGDSIDISGEMTLEVDVFSDTAIPMVTGLELGEITEPDPNRPSLILCRMGDQRLWDLAKAYGSTVKGIEEINGLQQEPLDDQILLIPVS